MCRIPVAMQERLQKELQQLEKQDIIAKVYKPTDWVSSIVVEQKNGKLCGCLDPPPLNKAVKRVHHLMPTVHNLLPPLAG